MELMDGRTGEPVRVGDVVRSVDRGDLLAVASIEEAAGTSPHPAVATLVPIGEPVTAYAVDDEELGGPVLDGYWLA